MRPQVSRGRDPMFEHLNRNVVGTHERQQRIPAAYHQGGHERALSGTAGRA